MTLEARSEYIIISQIKKSNIEMKIWDLTCSPFVWEGQIVNKE
jgi:hypothetical protein